MPEGTQLIALTKTFASQILKDYPDSLGDTGFDSIEAYMDQLAKCRHLQQMEEMFYQLCHGMEQYLEKQKDCSRIVSSDTWIMSDLEVRWLWIIFTCQVLI